MLIVYNLFLLFSQIPVHAVDIPALGMCGTRLCFNNAMCTPEFTCRCQRGYTGELCRDDRDECSSLSTDPCFHRGKCRNTYGSWRCDCLQGWNNRDQNQHHCDSKTSPDINFRKCMPGWKGEMCMDQCLTDDDCQKNQVCKKKARERLCLCVDGWTGSHCTTDIDECTGNPCMDYQICVNSHGSYACTCPVGWKGVTCSEDINECISNPCKHSGSCVNTNGSFSCNCGSGWKGTTCEVKFSGDDKSSISTGILLASFIWLPVMLITTVCTVMIAKHKWGKNRLDVDPDEDSVEPMEPEEPNKNLYIWHTK